MAGNGDLNAPKAWSVGTPTLTTGSHATPPAQGDVLGDGGNPDLFLGSFTLQIVNPTLGVAAVASPTGNGDVGDVFGAPDTSSTNFNNDGEGNVAGLVAFNTVAPTLTTGSHAVPAGNGDVGDTGGPTTLQGEPNDSNAGFGTLTSFSSGASTLGLGSLPANVPHGDIDDVQGRDSGPIFQVVWNAVTPTLVTQATTTPSGQGDIPNPYSWQDAITLLTSNIYPIDVLERFTGGGAFISIDPQFDFTGDDFTPGCTVTGGTLSSNLVVYSFWPAEHFQSGATVGVGDLHLALITYDFWPAENFTSGATVVSGDIHIALVTYDDWIPEHFQSGMTLTGGTLT